jgi:predicted PurR-regulated permease PerM
MQAFLSKLFESEYFFRYAFGFGVVAFCLVAVLDSISGILPPFIAAFIGAYILNTVVCGMEKTGLSRQTASAIVVLSILIILVILFLFALPFLQAELILLVQKLPDTANAVLAKFLPLIAPLSDRFDAIDMSPIHSQATQYMGNIAQWLVQTTLNLLSNGMVLANLISLIILTPIVLFYILTDWPALIHFINQRLPVLYAPSIRELAARIDCTLRNYAKGQLVVSSILMVLYTASLLLVDLRHAFLIGILTGFFSVIPFIGIFIGFLAAISVALSTFDSWGSIGLVFFVYTLIPLFEANFLTPRFIGEKIGLHPVWILFSVLASAKVFGFIGILFALPLAGMVGVMVRTWFAYISKVEGKNEPQFKT